MILTLIIFIIILAILILAHELGHFVAAKKSGVRVDEFGFGFPPRLFSVKKGETTYSINLIPLGGFVKIYGEGGEGKGEKRSFATKSISRRAIIITAGVIMNFLLAAFLFGVGHKIGLPTEVDENVTGAAAQGIMVEISGVSPKSPAEAAGIKIGDVIKKASVSGSQATEITINSTKEVQEFIEAHKGQKISLDVLRGKQELNLLVDARANPPPGEGPLGISLANIKFVSSSFFDSFIKGVSDMVNITILIVVVLAGIIHKAIIGSPVGEVLTGPVGIYNITSQAAGMGFIYLLQLTALLSINLGLINILPIPALDGGRLLFLGIEKVKGSPVSPKTENIIHTIGFVFLIFLMILVTYKDLTKLF